jgi:hypothetical protein
MKSLLALVGIALLGICMSACDSSSKGADATTTSASTKPLAEKSPSTVPTETTPASAVTKADADKDNDREAARDDSENNSVLDFGQEANASYTRAITTLIKRYYAAAYTENGTKACSLIYSTLAEAVPEDYGQSPPGPAYMSGTSCPAVMTLLFKHFHPQLALEYPKLKVARVRLIEHHGIAILSFGSLPERQIPVAREGHTWKVQALLDSELP